MSLRAAVVPVLPSWSHAGADPLSLLCLHGQPLYVHAARALASLRGARVLVTAPTGSGVAVRDALADAGLAGVRVREGVDTVGAALETAMDDLTSSSGPAAGHEVGVVLLHDPRCPLLPPSYLHEVLDRVVDEPGAVHVGAHAVTDTVKTVDDGHVLATVDREVLRVLTSPLAVSVAMLRQLHGDARLGECADMIDVIELFREARMPVRWVAAPSMGRRIADKAEVALLECLVEVRAGTRG
jgi:2-C-methyl-D-erythritol 4-phosphate cytidylyltransferase